MKSKDARSFDLERDLIKERKRKWYVKVIVLAGIVVGALTCAVISIPSINRDGLLRRIPETYTESEHLSPEDRELLNDIRTSFFPTSSIALPQGETDNIINTYANFLLNTLKPSQYKDADEHQYTSLREKYQEERSELYFTEQYRDRIRRSSDSEWIRENSDLDSNETMAEEQLKWNDKIVEAKTSAERNPIDDVIDGVKRHPEQDENDLRLNLNHEIFADAQPFWDNQGDEDTIRRNQASFMLQHMDLTADPCEDFYRYACGNWAAVHPIPADKAGSDTFEMLRENLDAILRDLLSEESIEDIAPKGENSFDGESNYLRVDAKENNEKRLMSSKVSFSEEVTPTVQDFTETTTVEYINKVTNNNGISNRKKRNDEDYVEIYINDDWLPQSLFRINNRKILARKTGHIIDYELRDFILKRDKKSADDIERIADEKDEPIHDKEDAITKAKNLYKSCMNYEILEQRGHQPLLALLNELGGWPLLDPNWNSTNFDWVGLMAHLRLYNNDILISEWVGPDIKNSDEFVIQFDQTTLGLPSRDYFLQPINSIYLEAYQTYLVKVATLLGSEVKNAEKQAVEIIDFETKLAKITSAFEERRNFSEAYQRLSIEKLHELVPKLNWKKYISIVLNRSINSDETVVIFALKYVQDLVDLIEKTEPKVVSNYLLWRFVRNRVNNLDDRFQDAKQIFYYILFGREQSPPRWKSCVSQVNSNMGMALGAMFVEKYFDETSKNETLIMTKEIQETFKELLNMTSWIDDETKSLASEKVNAMDLRIGYPNFISDKDELSKTFKDVNIDPDKYFENTLNILKHLTQVEQSRLGQPVNKTIWTTPPAVVNAYYSRNKNQIMFPAGILQPPFYHRHFPRSLNYGGIGVVIGHEITHGFDDKGRLFDRYGNLHKWWNDMAIEVFHKKAQCLIDQYGTYTMHEVAMPLNGLNTQGENIADNGGIKQAFRAYKHWLSENNDSDETLPGLNVTNTQLFFLNFAQIWCGAMRPEALKNKLKTAVHSPGRYRVIGTLSNSEDFAREYNCPSESPMNPSKKCNVW